MSTEDRVMWTLTFVVGLLFIIDIISTSRHGASCEVHWSYVHPDTLQYVRDFPDCEVRP